MSCNETPFLQTPLTQKIGHGIHKVRDHRSLSRAEGITCERTDLFFIVSVVLTTKWRKSELYFVDKISSYLALQTSLMKTSQHDTARFHKSGVARSALKYVKQSTCHLWTDRLVVHCSSFLNRITIYLRIAAAALWRAPTVCFLSVRVRCFPEDARGCLAQQPFQQCSVEEWIRCSSLPASGGNSPRE